MENLAQKLKVFRNLKGFTQKEMAEMLGIPQTTWSGYERGRSKPSIDVLVELEELGFDFKSDQVSFTDGESDRLKEIRKDLRLNQAKIAEKFEKVQATWSAYELGKLDIPADVYMALQEMGYNIEWLKTGKGQMKGAELSTTPKKGSVPFYRLDVMAHISETFGDLDRYNPEYYIEMPGFSHCIAFPVSGDSMSPCISSGDTIFVKPLHNFDVILWGEVYLVVTNSLADNLRTVKRVFQGNDSNTLILRSINPEYAGDTVIPKESVITMGLVKGCFKIFGL